MEQEIWKDIKGFEGLYQISNLGRAKSLDRIILTKNNKKQFYKGIILKQTPDKKGYFRIKISKNNKIFTKQIHTLVAQAFIPNIKNKKEVNHKDLNKQNNCITNLEWVSRKENMQHAFQNGVLNNFYEKSKKYNKEKCQNKYGYIYQYDKEMNYINKYPSAKVASEITGVYARTILACINNEPNRKTAGGYIWLRESEVVKNGI